MNNRIQALAEQAQGTKKHVPAVWQFYDSELETFAKLILQDSMAQIAMIGISNYDDDTINWTVQKCIEQIRHRFDLKDE